MPIIFFEDSGTFKPSDYGLKAGDQIDIICVGGGGGGGGGALYYARGNSSYRGTGRVGGAGGKGGQTVPTDATPDSGSYDYTYYSSGAGGGGAGYGGGGGGAGNTIYEYDDYTYWGGAGGGGGSGYLETAILAITADNVGTPFAVTVGAAGAGGTSPSSNTSSGNATDGGTGGTSSFGSVVSALGGNGGKGGKSTTSSGSHNMGTDRLLGGDGGTGRFNGGSAASTHAGGGGGAGGWIPSMPISGGNGGSSYSKTEGTNLYTTAGTAGESSNIEYSGTPSSPTDVGPYKAGVAMYGGTGSPSNTSSYGGDAGTGKGVVVICWD